MVNYGRAPINTPTSANFSTKIIWRKNDLNSYFIFTLFINFSNCSISLDSI